ncbi:MAG TPA: sugar-binding domain-containing protein [Candidatus Enterococcus avicola]|uniref:Sugar-binding domain-containing protein n=1 Tax=Candidatus Enterococcus avicola TaxID=2838561 RepID=A0A9D2F7X0_9ENTE|nr:sugar-binding domain-containing protein [Candidatus Enterococcus avicola]
MLDELKIIESIAPDIFQTVQERYRILQNIYWMQPVGRRVLADTLDTTERILRTETDLLKKLELIDTSKSGMKLTTKGERVYHQLGHLTDQLFGMDRLERALANHFGISRCLITPGNSDQQEKVIDELGYLLWDSLNQQLPNGRNVIAVMGGTTMAKVAEKVSNLETSHRHNLFVPARGGIGESVKVQANSVSAMMAMQSRGDYRSLYVPEQLSSTTYDSLLQEPSILEVLNLISEANCVIHSIGRAIHMAARRKMTEEDLVMLKQKNAVAESFGYFFNENGEVVYRIPRIGLDLKDILNIPYVFAVAGGRSKAKAIHAYMKNAPKQTWLITDEAAANAILKGVTL